VQLNVTGPDVSCANAGSASNAKANVMQASFILGFASGEPDKNRRAIKRLGHSTKAQSRSRQFYSPCRTIVSNPASSDMRLWASGGGGWLHPEVAQQPNQTVTPLDLIAVHVPKRTPTVR
jgi:hypothetical protein